jgi:redox-sensing transcriptional repressor
MSSTAAQVRKDFSTFGFLGKKKVGYEVDKLINNISTLLQTHETRSAIIAGLTPLGLCLIREHLLVLKGFTITAAFDDDPPVRSHDGLPAKIPLLGLDRLIEHVQAHDIRFGIIAANDAAAQRMLDLMAMAGIRGILNLTAADLKCPRECVVNSLSLAREFEKTVFLTAGLPPRHEEHRRANA